MSTFCRPYGQDGGHERRAASVTGYMLSVPNAADPTVVSDTAPGDLELAAPTPGPVNGDSAANTNNAETLSLYLREIGRIPLLTADEEVILARRIERCQTEELEGTCDSSIQPDGIDARRRLIEANLRLVVSVAKRYLGPSGGPGHCRTGAHHSCARPAPKRRLRIASASVNARPGARL